jgi:hypothetical protein
LSDGRNLPDAKVKNCGSFGGILEGFENLSGFSGILRQVF